MKEMKLQVWAIEKISPYERNAKKHDADQVKGIAASIEKFGWDQPIVVDKNGVIIKGHGRRLAAMQLGLTKVPVLVRDDLTPEQVRAARLADNRVALGGIDTETLKVEIKDIADQLGGIFTTKEMDFMNQDLGLMLPDALVADVGAAVAAQEGEARTAADAVADRRVPLAKAFGFKDIAGIGEIYISRFMARIENESGLKGEAALLHFLKSLTT